VEHVAAAMEATTRRPKDASPILVIAVDFLGDKYFLPFQVEEGEDVLEDPVSVANDPSAILISRTLSEEMGAKVGDSIELLTPDGARAFHVRAILQKQGLAESFGGEVVLMFSEAADAAFGRRGLVDRIDVALKKGADIEGVKARLQQAVGRSARVERPEGRTQHLDAITGPIRRALNIAA